MNQSKSIVMDISLHPTTLLCLERSVNFSWTTRLPYLGIHLTPTFTTLYQTNYPPLTIFCANGTNTTVCILVGEIECYKDGISPETSTLFLSFSHFCASGGIAYPSKQPI